jgi:radial spoke head protein 9
VQEGQKNNKMDWRGMNFALDYLASTGTVFSVEQRVAIQSSLTVLQQDNKFNHVHFLGKICGTERDYYMVCGIGKDYLKDRAYFYRYTKETVLLLK